MASREHTDQTLSRQAQKAELLDAETEFALARAWRDHRDQRALNRLITAYMRLAIATAARFRRYGVPMNDLIQEASLGLMKAADKFDPERGGRFSTYAVWWIKAGIQDYVMRNWSLVRTGSTSSQKALFFNLRRVQAKLEREAVATGEVLDQARLRQMVAEDMGVSLADVEMMEGRLGGGDFSLNAQQAAAEDGREWIDLLEDEAPQAAEKAEAADGQLRLRGWLVAALAALSARERYIVIERKLRGDGRTLESLGDELGLSKERIRQLESAAFAKLRKELAAKAGDVHILLE